MARFKVKFKVDTSSCKISGDGYATAANEAAAQLVFKAGVAKDLKVSELAVNIVSISQIKEKKHG